MHSFDDIVVFEDLFFFDHRFIFSLARVLCVVFFFGSDHNFGISFCPPCNVRGKCGTRDGCALVVEFASKEEARS